MNIQLAIQHGTNILIDKRINTAKLDAEILMAKALKKDRKYIILNNKEDIDDKNLKYFKELYIIANYTHWNCRKNCWIYKIFFSKKKNY